jgi:hypothetical protein
MMGLQYERAQRHPAPPCCPNEQLSSNYCCGVIVAQLLCIVKVLTGC